MPQGLEIEAPTTPEALDAVRGLCWDYLAFLKNLGGLNAQIIAQVYPDDTYRRLMADLATNHAPPSGGIRLARLNGTPVGCGMFHSLSPHTILETAPDTAPKTAEIKRVYVAPSARGSGTGRALMQNLITGIRGQGFQRILMDTGHPLTAAQDLYLSLGFRRRGPYQDMPDWIRDNMIYFEMDLPPHETSDTHDS